MLEELLIKWLIIRHLIFLMSLANKCPYGTS